MMRERKFGEGAAYRTVKLDRDLVRRIEEFSDAEFVGRCDAIRMLLERGLSTTVLGASRAKKIMRRAVTEAARGDS